VWDVRSAPQPVLEQGRTGLEGAAAAEQLATVMMRVQPTV
jgi:hypothetical protein